jgi:uncharacterized membrane protein
MCFIGTGFIVWILQGENQLVLESLQNGTAAYSPGFFSYLSAENIIALGLVSLILLPFVRVALVAVLFLAEKDFIYFGISVLVISILMAGVLIP